MSTGPRSVSRIASGLPVHPTPGRFSAGSALATLALAVSPWTGVRIAGVNLFDVVAPLAIVAILGEATMTGWRVVRLRWWVLLPSLAAVLVAAVQVFGVGSASLVSPVAGTSALGSTAFGDVDSPVFILARIAMSTVGVGLIVTSEILTFRWAGAARVARALVAGVAASALVQVLSQLGAPVPELRSFGMVSENRGTGLAFHPNSFALSLVVVLPLLVGAVLSARRPLRLVLSVGCSALVVVALFLADSRAGIIAGSVAIAWSAVYFGWQRIRLRPVVITSLALAPLMVALYVRYVVTSTRFSLQLSTDASAQARTVSARRGLAQWAENPLFGAGLGHGDGVSVPILLASSGGLLLVGAYTTLVVTCLVLGWRSRRRSIVAASAISVCAVLINGLASNSYAERFEFVTLFLVIGCAALVRDEDSAASDHAPVYSGPNPQDLRRARTDSSRSNGGSTTVSL